MKQQNALILKRKIISDHTLERIIKAKLSWNSVLSGKLVIIFMLAMLIFIHAG
jgi:hypothetical protein